MNIQLHQAYSFHQQGQRDYQEDSRFPNQDSVNSAQRFFIVCDGVGGCEKGEVASQTVCDAFSKALKRTDFSEEFTNEDFSHTLDTAYNALDAKANDENREMATTLAFVCFHGQGCTMAHIGDSRIYQIRPSEGVLYRSDDHSMVNTMVHNGILSPEQAINHPQGNVITRYMEPVSSDQNRCMATVMNTKNVQADDYFFLCSDGVLHCVSDDDLVDILSSEGNDSVKMQKIADLSRESEDNNTAILVHVKEVESDLETAEETELEEECSHTTKIIKVASQSLEEIESVQSMTSRSLWGWIKKLFI